jgi:hypothetical protein
MCRRGRGYDVSVDMFEAWMMVVKMGSGMDFGNGGLFDIACLLNYTHPPNSQL